MISSESEFDEISFIGKTASVKKHIAKILPDRNFISDLLNDAGTTAELSTKEEYQLYLNELE